MTRYALLVGAGLVAVTAGTAQAYEWGGGSCIGYDCARRIHDGDYRRARVYEYEGRRFEERRGPGPRAYQRRRIERYAPADDWDDDED